MTQLPKLENSSSIFFFVLAVICSISLFSCDKQNDCIDAFETQEFIKDKKYCLSGSDYFTLDSIQDGRCPLDVVCVWEGQVTFKTKVVLGTTMIDTTLIMKYSDKKSYLLGNYKFTPKEVLPLNSTLNGNIPRRIILSIEK